MVDGVNHLKTNPRDKTKCSRFAKKVIYDNNEKRTHNFGTLPL
jgi:hypothetical protein